MHDFLRTACPLVVGLTLSACYGPLGEPPESAARREITVSPEGEETDQCQDTRMAGLAAPPAFLDRDGVSCDAETEAYCFSLIPALREVVGDPRAALAASARAFARYRQSRAVEALALGTAYADLAVSGARSYAAFEASPPSIEDLGGDPWAASQALDRAYRVAWALRGPAAHRHEARPALGWVAVSAEDDPPARPVNVLGGPFPQTDVRVPVPLPDGSVRSVRTRVLVASTRAIEEEMVPTTLIGALPQRAPIRVPSQGDMLVFIHGHTSLAEEGAPLAAALLEQYRARGEDVTILSMDLPSNGYAERIDPRDIVAASALTDEQDDAVLRFLEAFLDALVLTLEGQVPDLRARIDAVIGGSLGGNLVLRLAERGVTWAPRVVAWSPASVDYSWSHGELVDLVKSEAVRLTRDESEADEAADSRRDYFVGGLMSLGNQASYWYRDGWRPCQTRFVDEGLAQIGETYDGRLRRWHYRVAYEQLVFSHIEPAPGETEPRFRAITAPVLLMTGAEDNSVPMKTWDFVRRLSPHLEMAGQTVYLENTGHAMHSERPRLVAEHIAGFVLSR